MRLFHENHISETVKSKVIISLTETVRLSVSISPKNLYNVLKSINEINSNSRRIVSSLKVYQFNPFALRKAKTLWSFGPSECNRVNYKAFKPEAGEVICRSNAYITEAYLQMKICMAISSLAHPLKDVNFSKLYKSLWLNFRSLAICIALPYHYGLSSENRNSQCFISCFT